MNATNYVAPLETTTGPHFICIGAQKAGTQWLYDQLNAHPAFRMPCIKELHYFDNDGPNRRTRELHLAAQDDLVALNERRILDREKPLEACDLNFLDRLMLSRAGQRMADYRALFAELPAGLTGDITPKYGALPADTIASIMTSLTDLRIVQLVRNPVERLWSQICMNVRGRKIRVGDLSNTERVRRWITQDHIQKRAFQSEAWMRWVVHTKPDHACFIFMDDIVNCPDAARRQVLEFLGADAKFRSSIDPGYNRKHGTPKPAMSAAVRELLVSELTEELESCAKIYGGHAEQWLVGATAREFGWN